MHNRTQKNWNNFALGLLVMVLPLLSLPSWLTKPTFILAGFFVALFSLARVGGSGGSDYSNASPSA